MFKAFVNSPHTAKSRKIDVQCGGTSGDSLRSTPIALYRNTLTTLRYAMLP